MSSDAGRWLAEAAGGDRAALETLLQRFLPQLHAYVHIRLGASLGARESSVDVVQSVCRQVLAARAVFEFADDERFKAWLFTAALNKMREKVRWHRGQKRNLAVEARSLDHDPVTAAAILQSPSQAAIGNETAAAVSAALESLREEYREVITLARIVQLPHQIIAEIMERSEPAVRKLLGRALLDLAAELNKRGIDMGALQPKCRGPKP